MVSILEHQARSIAGQLKLEGKPHIRAYDRLKFDLKIPGGANLGGKMLVGVPHGPVDLGDARQNGPVREMSLKIKEVPGQRQIEFDGALPRAEFFYDRIRWE